MLDRDVPLVGNSFGTPSTMFGTSRIAQRLQIRSEACCRIPLGRSPADTDQMLVHAVEVLLSPSFVPFSPLPYMICTAPTQWYTLTVWLAFSHWYTLTVWLALGVCYRFKEFDSLRSLGTLI